MPRFALVLPLALSLALASPAARADPAAAEALFREARSLLDRGDVEAACDKFEASNATEPSAGTLLNLAACRLRQGRTATAWAYFVSAARMARSQNRPAQEREARQRATELEPKLSYLTLRLSDPPPGLEVRRDGKPVEPATFGARVPLDPGRVVIDVSAPGHRSIRLEVTVEPAGDDRTLEIPKLVAESRGSSGTPPAPDQPTAAEPSRGPGAGPWILGGVGVAALAAGGVFGALALSSNSEAERLCENRTTGCPAESLDAADRRDRQATFATIGIGVGLAAVGAASVWLLGSSGARVERSARRAAAANHEESALAVRAGAALGRNAALVGVAGDF